MIALVHGAHDEGATRTVENAEILHFAIGCCKLPYICIPNHPETAFAVPNLAKHWAALHV